MTQKTVHVAILREGKLAGKASEDVQARIDAASSALSREIEQLRQSVSEAPLASPDGSKFGITDNGDGTVLLRTSS